MTLPIDAPLYISCTDHDCPLHDDGGSASHMIRCACGQPAVELVSADACDVRWSIGACRSCLDLAHADAPLPTGKRWPASVTKRGEHPAFVDVYRAGTHPMHEAPVPSAREFRKTVAELTTLVAGLLRVVR
jgi:hypothetical protein